MDTMYILIDTMRLVFIFATFNPLVNRLFSAAVLSAAPEAVFFVPRYPQPCRFLPFTSAFFEGSGPLDYLRLPP
jgi:hypothetical protein